MITRSKALLNSQALLDEVGWMNDRDVDHVRELISKGSDVNAMDNFMNTPLHMASKIFHYRKIYKLKEELDELSGKYTGESKVWEIIETLETRIRRAADIVELLLQRGANVNAPDDAGATPLHVAAGTCTNTHILEMLLEHGADVNARDYSRVMVPLHATAQTSSTRIVELLLEHGADVNARDDKKATPLHAAVDISYTGSTQMVELLLKHGADVNARDEEGETPLFRALYRCVPRILELLVEHGADVNAQKTYPKTDSDWSPLNYAVTFLSPTVVTLLLDRGANVNPEDTPAPPLHCAVDRPSPSIAKLLLERGANVNARDSEGKTPLHLAFEMDRLDFFKDLLDVLIEYGADLEARDDSERTPVFYIDCGLDNFLKKPKKFLAAINEFFSHGVCVWATDDIGYTFYDHLMAGVERFKAREYISVEFKKSIFFNHIKQLVALNTIGMAKKNRPLFFDIMNPFKKDITRLEQNHQAKFSLEENGDNLYESCLNEVGKLNTIQILQNINLADVLTLADPVILASVSNNVVFQRYAQSVDLSSKFPNYAFVINHQYQRGLQMQLLCQKCEISLRIVSSGKLHRYCAHGVLKYLSAIDLENLAQAVDR